MNGVNVFLERLILGLNKRGISSTLITSLDCAQVPVPSEIPIVDLKWSIDDGGSRRWSLVSKFLREHSPCIFLPGYDWFAAWKSTSLPTDIHVVGILHSDEPCYHALAKECGPYCSAVVAVSSHIARCIDLLKIPSTTIPYGVPCPARGSIRPRPIESGLRVIVASRLVQYQKRILDVPEILRTANYQGISLTLTIAGDGKDRDILEQQVRQHAGKCKAEFVGALTNNEVLMLFHEHDIFLMTSDFEGLPIALLEAMSCGCIPLVSDIKSGIHDVVIDGKNGFIVPVGDISSFVEKLALLDENPEILPQMSTAAHSQIRDGGFTINDMCEKYATVFRRISAAGCPQRHVRTGLRRPSRQFRIGIRDYLPSPIRRACWAIYRLLEKQQKCVVVVRWLKKQIRRNAPPQNNR
jgi:glycosyltransferase involved in cell wall biosynthesis